MNKKRGILVIFFLGVLFSLAFVSSLSGNPAKKEFNFEPGLKETITYHIGGVSENKELSLYVKGDLAPYVTLNKDTLIGPGEFTATMELPDRIDTLGKNRIVVVVSEVPKKDDELVGGGISVSISIGLVIDIYVPYPGKYLELELNAINANIGDPVRFDLKVISRGTEQIDISPIVNIYNSENEKVEILLFKNRTILGQETLHLQKFLDTTEYNAGNYLAEAVIDYGIPAKAETNFRIGALFIEIFNYTNPIFLGGTQKFEIVLQSGWNDKIDTASADVIFLDNFGKEITSFKTTPTDLTPWSIEIVEGYFDTSNFSQGFYDANITVSYFGKDQGRSSNKIVRVEFVEAKNKTIWYVIGASGFGIIIVLLLIKFVFRVKKKNLRKRR